MCLYCGFGTFLDITYDPGLNTQPDHPIREEEVDVKTCFRQTICYGKTININNDQLIFNKYIIIILMNVFIY